MEYAGQSKQVKQKLLICGLLSETEFWLVVIVVTVMTAVVTAVVTIGFCVVTVETGEMGMFNKVYSSGRYGHYTKTNGHYSGHYSGHYGRYKEDSRLQGHSQQHLRKHLDNVEHAVAVTAAARMSMPSLLTRQGRRRRIALAFSRCRVMHRDGRMWLATTDSGSPVLEDVSLAISLNTLCASGPHPPPSASEIEGMKVIPSCWQSSCVFRCSRLKSS